MLSRLAQCAPARPSSSRGTPVISRSVEGQLGRQVGEDPAIVTKGVTLHTASPLCKEGDRMQVVGEHAAGAVHRQDRLSAQRTARIHGIPWREHRSSSEDPFPSPSGAPREWLLSY